MSDQDVRLIGKYCDRHQRGEIEREFRIESGVERKRRRWRGEQGIPVRLSPACRLGADVGIPARPILDIDGMPPSAGQFLRDDARHQICDTTGPDRGNDLYGPSGNLAPPPSRVQPIEMQSK